MPREAISNMAQLDAAIDELCGARGLVHTPWSILPRNCNLYDDNPWPPTTMGHDGWKQACAMRRICINELVRARRLTRQEADHIERDTWEDDDVADTAE